MDRIFAVEVFDFMKKVKTQTIRQVKTKKRKGTTSLGGECKHFRTARPGVFWVYLFELFNFKISFLTSLLYALNYNWFEKVGYTFLFSYFF
jgi:hypothetical protein